MLNISQCKKKKKKKTIHNYMVRKWSMVPYMNNLKGKQFLHHHVHQFSFNSNINKSTLVSCNRFFWHAAISVCEWIRSHFILITPQMNWSLQCLNCDLSTSIQRVWRMPPTWDQSSFSNHSWNIYQLSKTPNTKTMTNRNEYQRENQRTEWNTNQEKNRKNDNHIK